MMASCSIDNFFPDPNGLPVFLGITPADNYDNLFILWFRLDFRVFNFIMVKNFFNF
jgi:hypothetical protein